jgi:hypothetical protein
MPEELVVRFSAEAPNFYPVQSLQTGSRKHLASGLVVTEDFIRGLERPVRESPDFLPPSVKFNNAWSFPTLPSLCAEAQLYIPPLQTTKTAGRYN